MIQIWKVHILGLTIVVVWLRKVFKQFSPLSQCESYFSAKYQVGTKVTAIYERPSHFKIPWDQMPGVF